MLGLVYQFNIVKLCGIRFFFWMHFFAGVLVPFYTHWGNITLSQVFFLNAWFMFWNFVLEIPTGTIADYLGRKWSLALGFLIGILAAIVYVSHPSLKMFMLGEVLFAMAYTLHSGADEALAYDSLKAIQKVDRARTVLSRMESFKLGGILVGTVIGSLIASRWGLNVPMKCYVIPAFIGFVIALFLKEPPFHEQKEHKSYGKILKEGTQFFTQHRVLLILTTEMAITNALAWSIIWLFQPLLERSGMGIAYFGVVHAMTCIGQILLLSNLDKIERWVGSKRGLFFIGSLIVGSAFGILGFVQVLPIVVAGIVLAFSFGLSRVPIFSAYMHAYIPSDKRATVISITSMMRTFGIVILNPIIGYSADRSLNVTLWIIGILLIIFALISRVEENFLIEHT